MRIPSFRISKSHLTPIRLLAVSLVVFAYAGCAGVTEDPTGAISITLKPGETGTCDTSPCSVSLVMPPGTGSYEVTANQVSVGTFPAGKTVNIGSFFKSQGIEVKGAGVPKAYVYIPQGM